MTVRWLVVCVIGGALALGAASGTEAAEWFVRAGAAGNGTSVSPFGRIQDGINAAAAGDIVTVLAGTYNEALRTVRSGTAALPIVVRAQGTRGTVVVTFAGSVARLDHPYVTLEGFVLDGQYSAADTVRVGSGAHYVALRNLEVRRSSRDLIDIGSPQGVIIEGCLIHHALNAAGGRTDAHGIAAGAVRDLTIRDSEIHTFSGDGFQVDPGRLSPGWDRVTLERSRIWLAPLPAAENGFAAGAVPGENAVDTKASASYARARITIRDVTAWGFRGGLISNMAAFNLKEHIDATVDRTTVYESEIAFRMRGAGSAATGAWVTATNAVVYNTGTAFRYEDNLQRAKIWNNTIGGGVASSFRAAASSTAGLEVRNLLVLGPLPAEAAHASNRSATADTFVNAAAHNYMLAPGSPALDAGIAISGVTIDRAGTKRPQGSAPDVGAYELIPAKSSVDEIVVYAANAAVVAGGWQLTADSTAAGGYRLWQPDAGAPALLPQRVPVHYFELQVWAPAGTAFRLWVRGKAEQNSLTNDSVYVQFSDSVDAAGVPIYRIATTRAARVIVQECALCPVSGWGWQDHAYGVEKLGPLVWFERSGLHTIRVQTMEDGMSIDQIVLSPSAYLAARPGAAHDDATILPASY